MENRRYQKGTLSWSCQEHPPLCIHLFLILSSQNGGEGKAFLQNAVHSIFSFPYLLLYTVAMV